MVELEKKLEHAKKREQKYKERIHMLQSTLIEFQEQVAAVIDCQCNAMNLVVQY